MINKNSQNKAVLRHVCCLHAGIKNLKFNFVTMIVISGAESLLGEKKHSQEPRQTSVVIKFKVDVDNIIYCHGNRNVS